MFCLTIGFPSSGRVQRAASIGEKLEENLGVAAKKFEATTYFRHCQGRCLGNLGNVHLFPWSSDSWSY